MASNNSDRFGPDIWWWLLFIFIWLVLLGTGESGERIDRIEKRLNQIEQRLQIPETITDGK